MACLVKGTLSSIAAVRQDLPAWAVVVLPYPRFVLCLRTATWQEWHEQIQPTPRLHHLKTLPFCCTAVEEWPQ